MKLVQQLFSGLGLCSSKSGRGKINPCRKMFDMHKKWRLCRGGRGKYVNTESGRQSEARKITIRTDFIAAIFWCESQEIVLVPAKLGSIFDALKRVSKSFDGAATAAISSYRQVY